MKKFAFIFIFCTLFFQLLPWQLTANAQVDRSQYNLLWKISGNGLQKPSYLFGTMHLKDKRVFDFSDSVLVKLDDCEAFVMEITPDSVFKTIFTELATIRNNKDTTDRLKAILSREEYEALDKRLQDEAGVSIDKVKSKDPWIITMLLNRPVAVSKKSDKTTFLDAYLYRLAKQQGKKVIGVEKVSEQFSIFDQYSLKDELQRSPSATTVKSKSGRLEDLIRVYHKGNIGEIYQMVTQSGMSDAYEKKLLTDRNATMVNRLVSLMASQTTFIAVGAAHLPGEKGMIQLFKNKGYTVTPVQATFTGMAGCYQEKVVPVDWFTFKDPAGEYTVDMPTEPYLYQLPLQGGSDMTMHMLPELGSGMIYYSASLTLPMRLSSHEEDNVFRTMIDRMTSQKGTRLLAEKKIHWNQVPGREIDFFTSQDVKYTRGRLYIRGSRLYMLMVSGSEAQLADKEAVRFFESLRLLENKTPDWNETVSQEGAFRVKSQVPLVPKKREVEGSEGKIYLTYLSGTDHPAGTSFTVLYSDYDPGMVIMDDSIFFAEVINKTVTNSQGKLIDQRVVTAEGFPGRDFTIQGPALFVRGRVFLRASRSYLLLVTGPQAAIGETASIDLFFNSFEFIPYRQTVWQDFVAPDQSYSLKIPGKAHTQTDSLQALLTDSNRNESYASQNPGSGSSYIWIVGEQGPYYQIADEETYFKDLVKQYLGEKDSLVKEDKSRIAGMPARDWVVQTSGNHTLKRIRALVRGSKLYQLLAYVPLTASEDPEVQVFFNSLQFGKEPIKGNLFSNKTDLLLSDLRSGDTITRQQAFRALAAFDFTTQEIPKLYKALQQTYLDDTASTRNTRRMLWQSLATTHDSTTTRFVGEHYNQLSSNAGIQLEALKVLTAINTKESLTLFTDLILAQPPKIESDYPAYDLFFSLSDSLAASKVMYPRLLDLLAVPEYRNALYAFTLQLRDSSVITTADFTPYKAQLVKDCEEKLSILEKRSKQQADYYSVSRSLSLLADLLGGFPQDAATKELLIRMQQLIDNEVALAAQVTLLKNGFPIDKKRMTALAAHPATRTELYRKLTDLQQVHLFPAKYRTQKYFAESALVAFLSEDGEAPDQIELIAEKDVSYEGEKGRAFLFKFRYLREEQKEWYVGISGLQPQDKKQVTVYGNLVYSDYQSLKTATIDQHFKRFLQGE
jgi:uncharacterized protein YbaP (TraB family)